MSQHLHSLSRDYALSLIRGIGGCGAISPDGARACILAIDHQGPHDWERGPKLSEMLKQLRYDRPRSLFEKMYEMAVELESRLEAYEEWADNIQQNELEARTREP